MNTIQGWAAKILTTAFPELRARAICGSCDNIDRVFQLLRPPRLCPDPGYSCIEYCIEQKAGTLLLLRLTGRWRGFAGTLSNPLGVMF
ncbi:hypothetical protein [Streptomyces syringium]|uniref:hypothetical protein n=1 Tax=Streptomyces syringium TaxID=76729 RepID=UPI0033F04155